MTKTRPKQGDVFEVDLGEGLGTVRGVIARKKGPLHLVYAFLPRPAQALRPEAADFVGIVGTQGFAAGRWDIKGPLPDFTRQGWPIPRLGRLGLPFEGQEGPAWIITLDDELDEVGEERVPRDVAARLPSAGVHGAAAAEIAWRKLARHAQRPAA